MKTREKGDRFGTDDDEIVKTEWPEDVGKEPDRQKQFREDMSEAGYRVEFYRGRFYYMGWAVRTEGWNGLQDAIRATKIYLQYDQLGKDGNIVYPRT